MDSLRNLRRRVFSKTTPLSPTYPSSQAPPPKKKRDKKLRHSRSLPLRSSSDTDPEVYIRKRPIYRGDKPLKTSDIHLLIDIKKGRPEAPIVHAAFQDDTDDEEDAAKPRPKPRAPPSPESRLARSRKPSRAELVAQFPVPPKALPPLPLNPKQKQKLLDQLGPPPNRPPPPPEIDLTGIKFYDDLLPPPSREYESMMRAREMRARLGKEPYYSSHLLSGLQRSSSATVPRVTHPNLFAYPDVELPYALEKQARALELEIEATREMNAQMRLKRERADASRETRGRKVDVGMSHANFSTKSLGSVRHNLKQGPPVHPVVLHRNTGAMGSQHAQLLYRDRNHSQTRPRNHSNASVHYNQGNQNHVSTYPSHRRQPRQRVPSSPTFYDQSSSDAGHYGRSYGGYYN